MDEGVSPSASQNPKVSKPSLGVRVLRTLFDNSPPTYTPAKSQQSAAQAKEKQQQQQLKELQKAQELRKAQQQQAQAQQGQKNGISRPPTPRNPRGEVVSRQPDRAAKVIDTLAERNGRFPPGFKKGGHGKPPHVASKASAISNDKTSSFDFIDDAHSSVSTESDNDSLSFYSNKSQQDREVRNMNRSVVRDLEEDSDLRWGHVDDSLVPDADKELNSAKKLEHLKQEIERLRLENLVLRQRGAVNNHHHHRDDSDLSRASSMTEVSNAEEAAEEWIPYADYAPPGVTSASVARFNGQYPAGYRRGEIPRHSPGERYFPREHPARVAIGEGGGVRWRGLGGHGSSSETASMVTDGSRTSSRHHSGLLVDPEPQSGLTSRHNSGLRSEYDDHSSTMSWEDGSMHNGGPMFADRQELYGVANNNPNYSRGGSRNNSGRLVDYDDFRSGGSVTPAASNSGQNSRQSSGMQVDREGRDVPPGLISPRMSFEGQTMTSNMPVAMHPSNSSIKTVEETFTNHRLIIIERGNVVEPDTTQTNVAGPLPNGNKYDEFSTSATHVNSRSNNNYNIYESRHIEAPSRTSTPPPIASRFRSFEHHEATTGTNPTSSPTATPNFGDNNDAGHDDFGSYNRQYTSSSPAATTTRSPTPPRSRNSSHELDPTNSSVFSYPIPSTITVPRPRSQSSHNHVDAQDMSQFLDHQQQYTSLSMDNAQVNSVPRSMSTHSQMSTEDSESPLPATTVASQHQSTLERLMISQQRRQNMSSNPVSQNTSPDQQFLHSRNSRQLHSRSPHKR